MILEQLREGKLASEIAVDSLSDEILSQLQLASGGKESLH